MLSEYVIQNSSISDFVARGKTAATNYNKYGRNLNDGRCIYSHYMDVDVYCTYFTLNLISWMTKFKIVMLKTDVQPHESV